MLQNEKHFFLVNPKERPFLECHKFQGGSLVRCAPLTLSLSLSLSLCMLTLRQSLGHGLIGMAKGLRKIRHLLSGCWLHRSRERWLSCLFAPNGVPFHPRHMSQTGPISFGTSLPLPQLRSASQLEAPPAKPKLGCPR